jgi:hypothetical protein
MAAKKTKKSVTIEIELEVLEKLVEAAEALSELAQASVNRSNDPQAKALLKKKKKKTRR